MNPETNQDAGEAYPARGRARVQRYHGKRARFLDLMPKSQISLILVVGIIDLLRIIFGGIIPEDFIDTSIILFKCLQYQLHNSLKCTLQCIRLVCHKTPLIDRITCACCAHQPTMITYLISESDGE